MKKYMKGRKNKIKTQNRRCNHIPPKAASFTSMQTFHPLV
jgi:hypothetical protein